MKILFINDQFERGGAARVAAIQCNGLHRRGYDIILVTDSENWSETYPIDKDIPRRDIVVKSTVSGTIAKIKKWLKCSKQIRQYIKQEKPDVILAVQSMMFLCTWIGNLGLRVPVIAADHTSFTRKIDPIIDFVRYHLYSRAEGLSILTEKDAIVLGQKFPRKTVIYNPLSFPVIDYPTTRQKRVLCAGRLEDWKIKGLDRMISMWAQIALKYPDWKLEIAGSGTEQSVEMLEKMIAENNVTDSVRLLGQVNNMRDLYAGSEIFALPSRMEGFPMVLMEAMSQGCACVAFSIGGASDEMIDGKSGIIVPDGECGKFVEGLRDLMNDSELRKNYSSNAITAISKFTVETFINEWENLINKTLKLK